MFFIFLLLKRNYFQSFFYFFISIILIFITNISYQKIGYGKVYKIYDNSYLINNGSYNVLLRTKRNLNYDNKIFFDENKLKEPEYFRSTYGFNKEMYFKSENIQFILQTDDFKVNEVFSFRNLLKKNIDQKNESVSKYYNYFIFGIKDLSLYDELNDYIGLSYYGLNFILYRIFSIFVERKNIKLYSSFLMLIFFIFNPSFGLFRIILINILSLKIKEKNELIGFSYLILMLLFPFKIYSISYVFPYILSVYSVFKSKFLNQKTLIILMSSHFFNSINILKVLFFNIFQIINGIMFIISFVFIFNEAIYYFFVKIFKKIVLIINNDLFEIYGKINILGIIFYFLLVLLLKNIKKFKKHYILIFILFLNISNLFFQICFINVGHGDSILIKDTLNKGIVLIDTGDTYSYANLKNILKAKGIKKLDYLVITHNDKDHNGNLERIKKDFKIKNIIFNHTDIKINGLKLFSLNSEKSNDNDSSIVLLGNINGLNLLFTGDISKKVEKEIIKKYPLLKIDILKVAHHGSNSSSDENFVKKIETKVAIISSGNKYNLPKREVINIFERNNIHYFITKEKGDIEIFFTFFGNFIKNSLNEIHFLLK